jgi:ammonia channel protein AmtB
LSGFSLVRHDDRQRQRPPAKTIPEVHCSCIYQMTFAVITVALVAGSVADRMRFSVLRAVLRSAGSSLVYIPLAHWVWGGGFLAQAGGTLDFAGGLVVHLSAGTGGPDGRGRDLAAAAWLRLGESWRPTICRWR